MNDQPNNTCEMMLDASRAALAGDTDRLCDLMELNEEWMQTEEERDAMRSLLSTLEDLSSAQQ